MTCLDMTVIKCHHVKLKDISWHLIWAKNRLSWYYSMSWHVMVWPLLIQRGRLFQHSRAKGTKVKSLLNLGITRFIFILEWKTCRSKFGMRSSFSIMIPVSRVQTKCLVHDYEPCSVAKHGDNALGSLYLSVGPSGGLSLMAEPFGPNDAFYQSKKAVCVSSQVFYVDNLADTVHRLLILGSLRRLLNYWCNN